MKSLLGVTMLVSIAFIANTSIASGGQFDYLQNELTNTTGVSNVQNTAVEKTTSTPSGSSIQETLSASVSEVQQKAHYGKNITNTQAPTVVSQIGKKLMADASVDKYVEFVFSSESVVNAYNDAQGNVVVYRGVMDYCEDEAELAFIIGHELGHAVNYHVAKGMVATTARNIGEKTASNYAKNAISSKLTSKLGTFGIDTGTVTDKAINVAGNMAETKYSRTHEKDADLEAVDFLVKSGYNPLAGISVLYKISDNFPDLFADHPSTDKRVIAIFNYVKEKYPEYITKGYNSEAYKEAVTAYGLK